MLSPSNVTAHASSRSATLTTTYVPLSMPSHTSSPSPVSSHRTSHPRCRSLSHLGAFPFPSFRAPAHHADTWYVPLGMSPSATITPSSRTTQLYPSSSDDFDTPPLAARARVAPPPRRARRPIRVVALVVPVVVRVAVFIARDASLHRRFARSRPPKSASTRARSSRRSRRRVPRRAARRVARSASASSDPTRIARRANESILGFRV